MELHCPECAQLLTAEASTCPACGHAIPRHPVREPIPLRHEVDEEKANADLLHAIVTEPPKRS